MIEELCATALKEAALAIIDRTPLVKVKPKIRIDYDQTGRRYVDKNLIDPWADFLTKPRWETVSLRLLPKLDGRKGIWRKDSVERRAWVWMNENDTRIIDGFIRERWGGDLRHAMEVCRNEDALHQSWLDYFRERRNAFMENEKALIDAKSEKLKIQGRLPSSHGGVANLLRVLTKTMQQEGASILTIARVQYAVCIQAGIMLPNEFLTDVLVAEEIATGIPTASGAR